MKKSSSVLIGIVVIIIIAVGAYAIFHKSSKPKATATSSSASQSKAPAVNDAVLTTKTDSKLGQYLADPSGKALYTYGADTSGVSNCTGPCLTSWPPYQDTGSTANLPAGVGTITRSDNGQVQYTYMGMPLYYFTGDSAGQVTGNGVSNFSIATPGETASAPSTTATPSTSNSSTQSNTNSSSGYSSY